MPIRIPMHQIVVQRGDQRLYPEIGRPFDFTDAEIAEVFGAAATEEPFDAAAEETAKAVVEAAKPAGKGKGKAADADDL